MESQVRHERPKLGGLNHLERLLQLRQDSVLSTDAVFISLDLEVASDREKLHLSPEKPVVRQLGFARLDTRDIRSLSSSSNLESLILLSMFENNRLPKPKGLERPCLFAQTQHIALRQIPATIRQNLCIQDTQQKNALRKIVLVGHSIRQDLKILHLLGIDTASLAQILTIIDTHSISRFLLPPFHPGLPTLPGQKFTLAGVLAQLGYKPRPWGFHNAGNDAVYTLYVMILLAIKRVDGRASDLSESESTSLEAIRCAVLNAVNGGLFYASECVSKTTP